MHIHGKKVKSYKAMDKIVLRITEIRTPTCSLLAIPVIILLLSNAFHFIRNEKRVDEEKWGGER